jgi:hypothetical protein
VRVSNNRQRAINIQHAQRERAIRQLAARQGGRLSRAQLLAAGLSDSALRYRIRSGRYVTEHPGVYGIAPVSRDLAGPAWAAVLACGPGAVVSHLTAAVLWNLLRHHRLPIHVTAPGYHLREGIITHRCATLLPRDLTHQRGVPVTSRARTVLDIAPLISSRELRRIINDSARAGALRLDALGDVLERNGRHPGARLLRPILAATGSGLTRSGLEDDFLDFLTRSGLPLPQLNVVVDGIEVDAYYPEHDLIIELDTLDYHGDPQAFEGDRDRDAAHLAHGRPTLRITGERLDRRPDAEAERLGRILAARAPRPTTQDPTPNRDSGTTPYA